MNLLAITILSHKKLNTYGVESPCKCLPGVGSFLANPGLSKEQLVPSCTMRACIMADVFIEILVHFAMYLFVYCPKSYYEKNVSTP